MISLINLGIVFILIAVRRIGKVNLKMWQVMLGGAISALITGEISPQDAIKSINPDVMLFLFGMFVVGRALEVSGYLAHISSELLKKARTPKEILLFMILGFGLISGILMNDTVAIVGTPVVLHLSKRYGISPKPFLLALAFAVTVGSVPSPIGNPQNLIIATLGNMKNPFVDFGKYLLIPTLLNLFLIYFLIKVFYRDSFSHRELIYDKEPVLDRNLAFLSKISLILIVLLIFVKVLLFVLKVDFDFKLTYIALVSMLPIVLFSRRRFEIIKGIDWYTLIFFASMFVLMESVWRSGFFQSLISSFGDDITSLPAILFVSVVLSQFISNVPLVALYLPMLMHAGVSTKELVTLAVGSTIAGNFSILGAASNVIIIQNAEIRNGGTITFFEFARIGVPLTILNIIVYWIFLKIIP